MILEVDNYRKITVTECIIDLLITTVLVIELNADFKSNQLIRYTAIGLLFVVVLAYVIKKEWVYFTHYSKWSLMILGYYLLSIFWSISSNYTVQMVKNVLIVTFISNIILISMDRPEKIDIVLKSLALAIVLNSLYVIKIVGISNLGLARLGKEDYKQLALWNANELGIMTAYGVIVLVVLITTNTGIAKAFLFALMMMCLSMTFFTGSRTAMGIIVVFFLVFYFLRNQGIKRLNNSIVIVGIMALAYAFIMNNKMLYSIIGSRVNNLVQILTKHASRRENSFSLRRLMIERGIEWFAEKPIIGFGLDSFRELFFRKYRILYYAHNNFIELLVDIGSIGFIIYYYIDVYIYRLLKKCYRNSDCSVTAALYLGIMASIVVCDMGSIGYYKLINQIMIMICFAKANVLAWE